MRAMSLCSDEAENDQNEFRDLKMSLENTKGLVESLSKQLFDLKDQVSGKHGKLGIPPLIINCSKCLTLNSKILDQITTFRLFTM